MNFDLIFICEVGGERRDDGRIEMEGMDLSNYLMSLLV